MKTKDLLTKYWYWWQTFYRNIKRYYNILILNKFCYNLYFTSKWVICGLELSAPSFPYCQSRPVKRRPSKLMERRDKNRAQKVTLLGVQCRTVFIVSSRLSLPICIQNVMSILSLLHPCFYTFLHYFVKWEITQFGKYFSSLMLFVFKFISFLLLLRIIKATSKSWLWNAQPSVIFTSIPVIYPGRVDSLVILEWLQSKYFHYTKVKQSLGAF